MKTPRSRKPSTRKTGESPMTYSKPGFLEPKWTQAHFAELSFNSHVAHQFVTFERSTCKILRCRMLMMLILSFSFEIPCFSLSSSNILHSFTTCSKSSFTPQTLHFFSSSVLPNLLLVNKVKLILSNILLQSFLSGHSSIFRPHPSYSITFCNSPSVL